MKDCYLHQSMLDTEKKLGEEIFCFKNIYKLAHHSLIYINVKNFFDLNKYFI